VTGVFDDTGSAIASPDGLSSEDAELGSGNVPGLVSVVIIFHNEECYLSKAVESVRAQTYPHWEMLLVDDGSSDASPGIARRLAEENPQQIRVLMHPGGVNRGMSASRNLGLVNARGEYVAFLDADDEYLPERLQRHVEVLAAYPDIQMSVSDHIRLFADDGDGSAATEFARPFFVVGDQIWRPPLGLMVIMGTRFLGLGICNVTVRRRTALAVGGFNADFTGMYEDQVFISRVLVSHPVYVLQAYLARYRYHPASFTRRLKEAGKFHEGVAHADTIRFVDWLLAHLARHGIDDPWLHRMVESQRGSRPGAAQRLRIVVGALVKRALRALLPTRWYRRLLLVDYERECRRARQSYARLAAELTQRALERAER
jgi:glycosyltransferase involved in cell wall biosynthesis